MRPPLARIQLLTGWFGGSNGVGHLTGSNYFLYPEGGSAVELSYAGALVVAGPINPAIS